ncbi:MAG TPA: cysteine--tRNA ligase [Vineibacter sp.]|nr:cysteine--tRNA ligase [Vineibacter sp.]
MSLVVYNTLTRRKEEFAPLDPAHVRMYVCGPTVYDHVHIGNARPVVVFDVLYRLLKWRYPRVTYVRNITDIDDRIINRSRESGESIESLTQRTTDAYQTDMKRLGAIPPDAEPRATEYVAQMIGIIERLIPRGHAYAADGHVLFSVPSMADYGRLSRHSRDELVAGARVDVAPYKKDAADFVLWKPSTPEQPGWESPWGRGRPGWHIECSAMSGQLLGETFDIHAGGIDLIFPHHENEIAQSRSAFGTTQMATYWMHNGFLVMGEGEKMSKSLGNFFTVRELLDEFPGEAIRLLLLTAQYRQPLGFTKDGLRTAKAQLDRLYQALRATAAIAAPPAADVPSAIAAALDDDLNTPLALSHLHELAADLNRAATPEAKATAKAALLAGASALGLLWDDPEAWFRWTPSAGGPSEAEIEAAIGSRQAARKARNFAEADRIRDDLAARGVLLEDGPKGTTWKRA